MILASKSGLLIAVRVLKKTRYGSHVQPVDSEKSRFVSRRDTGRGLFSDAGSAIAFASSALRTGMRVGDGAGQVEGAQQ